MLCNARIRESRARQQAQQAVERKRCRKVKCLRYLLNRMLLCKGLKIESAKCCVTEYAGLQAKLTTEVFLII